MADARFANFVVVLNFLPLGPFIKAFMQFGAFDILCRLKMVGRYDNFILVEYLVDSLFNQHRYRRRRRYIVTHHHVNLRID